jgi:hypothetical protein
VNEAARDLVSVIEVKELRELDADPEGLAVPELVRVTLGFVALIVELTLGVRVCFDATVELGDALDVLDACKVFV